MATNDLPVHILGMSLPPIGADAWEDVAERLIYLRRALGMNQAQFGRHLGVPPQTMNHYEKPDRGFPVPLAIKLCKSHRITLEWLYRGDPQLMPYDLMQRIEAVAAEDEAGEGSN